MLNFYSKTLRSIPWTRRMIEKMWCIVPLYSDENNYIIPWCLTNNISLSLSHLNNTLLRVFFFTETNILCIWYENSQMRVTWRVNKLRTNTSRTRTIAHLSISISQNLLWVWLQYIYMSLCMTESFVIYMEALWICSLPTDTCGL